jgi:hypothetical protein
MKFRVHFEDGEYGSDVYIADVDTANELYHVIMTYAAKSDLQLTNKLEEEADNVATTMFNYLAETAEINVTRRFAVMVSREDEEDATDEAA